MKSLAALAGSRELLVNLTLRDLRGKYKRSLLGWTWSLLNPLSTMLIFSLVFKFLLKVPVPVGEPSGLNNFAAFLLCGLLPWNFFAGSLTGGMGTIIGNGGLIKKVHFPSELLVYAAVLSLDVALLIEMGVLVVFLLVLGNMVLPWLLPALVVIALFTAFAAGITLVFAVLNVYFRDMQYLVGILLQFLFYMAPIVYPVSLVPEEATLGSVTIPVYDLYRLNPMVEFMGAFRAVLYDLRFPSAFQLGYITVWSIASLAIGTAVYRRFQGRLAEEL